MHDTLIRLLQDRDVETAKELMAQADPEQIADALRELPAGDRQHALQILDQKTALAVFELLDQEGQDGLSPVAEEPVAVLATDTVRLLLAERQFEPLRQMLSEMNPVDVARLLDDLPSEEAVVGFRLLPKDAAVLVFEQMESDQQQRLLESFTDERARDLVAAMSPDDRARLLDEVPANVTHRLVRLLPPRERQATLTLLGYADSSAGRIMTPDFVDLRANMTVAQALERIRMLAMDKETIFYAYVTDAQRRLLGAVSLKDLVLSAPGVLVRDIMGAHPKSVTTQTDQEEVAKVIRDYDLLAVPVVDAEERLVGIVTHDDVLDIIEEEATEDIYRFGAVPVAERTYFNVNALVRAGRRGPWLLFLMVMGFITGMVIAGQEQLLAEVAILAAFIPLLIGTAGNIGAQSSTVVVRGLATGEISARRAVLTLSNEAVVGVLLGAMLGVLTFLLGLILSRGDVQVGIVVGTSLAVIAAVAAMVGGGLPFLFRLLKVDPAVASAPLVATIMDVFGVIAYFLIANALFQF